MPDELMIDGLGDVPRFGRMDEYFGLWSIEGERFRAGFQRMAGLGAAGLIAHMQAYRAEGRAQRQRLYTHVAAADIQAAAGRDTGGYGYPEARAGEGGMKIAVIALSGVLMKQIGSMDDGTSSVLARADIRHAARNPDIAAILLLIDSPGGTVSGTEDLAAEVRAAAAAKPCYGLVEGMCASAAYWVGSCCTKLFATGATALVGSIGTYAVLYDTSAAAAMEGVKAHLLTTGPLKGAGVDGVAVTPAQVASYQDLVNNIQTHFAAAVGKNRKMSAEDVAAVATGAVFLAADAQAKGLLDGVKSFEQVLGLLGAAALKRGGTAGGMRAENDQQTMADGTVPAVEQLPTLTGGTKQEDAMSDPITAPGTAPKAASLKELKAALPKSTAEFRESCLEKGMSLAESQAAYIAASDATIEDLQAKTKTIGVAAVREAGGKVVAAIAGAGGVVLGLKEAKSRLNALTSGLLASGMARPKAFREACRQDPDAHKALVVAHNVKFGRKKQAAQFAEEFENPQHDDD